MPSRAALHFIEAFAVTVTLAVSYFVTTVFIALFIGAEAGVTIGFYTVLALTILLSCWAIVRNWWRFRKAPTHPDEYEELHTVVGELADEMGITKPAVGVDRDSGNLNAFATFILPTRPLVVFTEPMLSADEDILRAVVAHELSHIKSRDMYLTILLTYVESGIETVEEFLRDVATGSIAGALFFGPFYLVALAATTLNTVLFYLVSRTREYKADYDAAATTSPDAMMRALELMQTNQKQEHSSESLIQTVPRQVSDALFSTHPDTEDRIESIRDNFD